MRSINITSGLYVLALVIMPIASMASQNQTTKEIRPVTVAVTTQDAEGVTESELDGESLKGLETWMVQTMLQKGRNSYASMGYNPNDFKPSVDRNSVYMSVGGKKLAVIKITLDNSVKSVAIIGIMGNELQRITCLRGSNHDIPVWSGACGEKIEEIFSLSIRP